MNERQAYKPYHIWWYCVKLAKNWVKFAIVINRVTHFYNLFYNLTCKM
jgi:hypothetical protein